MTKRRKVWVRFHKKGNPLLLGGPRNVADWKVPNSTPFIERKRGDVVLSREEVARAQRLLDEATAPFKSTLARLELPKLLRGGR